MNFTPFMSTNLKQLLISIFIYPQFIEIEVNIK